MTIHASYLTSPLLDVCTTHLAITLVDLWLSVLLLEVDSLLFPCVCVFQSSREVSGYGADSFFLPFHLCAYAVRRWYCREHYGWVPEAKRDLLALHV